MKIKMKISDIDEEMVEIFTVSTTDRHTLWCVSHYDLLYELDCFARLKEGETITFELTETND